MCDGCLGGLTGCNTTGSSGATEDLQQIAGRMDADAKGEGSGVAEAASRLQAEIVTVNEQFRDILSHTHTLTHRSAPSV